MFLPPRISSSPPPFDDSESHDSAPDVGIVSTNFSRINLDADEDSASVRSFTLNESISEQPVRSDEVKHVTHTRYHPGSSSPIYPAGSAVFGASDGEDDQWNVTSGTTAVCDIRQEEPNTWNHIIAPVSASASKGETLFTTGSEVFLSDEVRSEPDVDVGSPSIRDATASEFLAESEVIPDAFTHDTEPVKLDTVARSASFSPEDVASTAQVLDQEDDEDDWGWADSSLAQAHSESHVSETTLNGMDADSGHSSREEPSVEEGTSLRGPSTACDDLHRTSKDSRLVRHGQADPKGHEEPATKPEVDNAEEEDDWAEFAEFSSAQAPGLREEPVLAAPCAVVSVDVLSVKDDGSFEDTINTSFHENLYEEEPLPSLNLDSQIDTVPFSSSEDLWSRLKHLDETYALGFQWASSAIRKSLLSSLRLNYQSAFSMGNKDPVQLDGSNTSDDSHQNTSTVTGSDDSKSGKSDFRSLEVEDTLSLSSDAISTTNGNIGSSWATAAPPPATKTLPSYSPIPPITRLTANGINVAVRSAEEIDDVIKKFRDLSYMRSKVLVTSKRGTKPSFKKLP